MVSGIDVYEAVWAQAKRVVARRAAFELKCPEKQIEFGLVNREGREPTEISAAGCGKRAMYERPIVRINGYAAIGDWRAASIQTDEGGGG